MFSILINNRLLTALTVGIGPRLDELRRNFETSLVLIGILFNYRSSFKTLDIQCT